MKSPTISAKSPLIPPNSARQRAPSDPSPSAVRSMERHSAADDNHAWSHIIASPLDGDIAVWFADVKGGEKFWLQTGSFSTESDAENLKARLAFAGWEASVQQGLLPDKVVRFRVRLGPYDNQDEMQRIKTELGKRGFEAAVIKF